MAFKLRYTGARCPRAISSHVTCPIATLSRAHRRRSNPSVQSSVRPPPPVLGSAVSASRPLLLSLAHSGLSHPQSRRGPMYICTRTRTAPSTQQFFCTPQHNPITHLLYVSTVASSMPTACGRATRRQNSLLVAAEAKMVTAESVRSAVLVRPAPVKIVVASRGRSHPPQHCGGVGLLAVALNPVQERSRWRRSRAWC